MSSYLVITLFGAEIPKSILEADRWEQMLSLVERVDTWYGDSLSYRVTFQPEGRPVRDSKRRLTAGKLRAEFKGIQNKGRFLGLELRDSQAYEMDSDPEVFFSVHKFWTFVPGTGHVPETKHEAGNCVCLAVSIDLLKTEHDLAFWLGLGQECFTQTDGIVGFAEAEVPWASEEFPGGLESRLVDMRFEDVLYDDYRWADRDGALDLRTKLGMLAWGYYLSAGHVQELGGAEALQGQPLLSVKQPLDETRWFVSLAPRPHKLTEYDAELLRQGLQPLLG